MPGSEGLLSGTRVLDLTRVLAGPFCTMMLGDLGADVIKVEAPGRGDDTRSWGPPFAPGGEAAYFLSANRNKRSLTLNLKGEAGRRVLLDLIRWADVVVENFRTGTLAEWGLDPDELERLHPGLIYCTITGYGATGPYRERPGYDLIVQAEGGFMSLTGPEDGDPYRAGVAIADLAAGMFAACAILAAIAGRKPNAAGERIDISLLDSQVALLSYVASNYLVSGQTPRRHGNAHPNIVPYQSFRAQDGQFAFAAGNDVQWRRFCQAVGKDGWASDPRYSTNAGRLENRRELVAALGDLFANRPVSDWLTLCREIGIPAGAIRTLDQVFEDPQVRSRGMRVEVDHPSAGRLAMVGSPLRFSRRPVRVRYPPPLLGQHTQEILTEVLGYSEEQVSDLRGKGAI